MASDTLRSWGGTFLRADEEKIFTDNGGEQSRLKFRYCMVCDKQRNCYNGWCAECLTEFKSINGRWPCQASKP